MQMTERVHYAVSLGINMGAGKVMTELRSFSERVDAAVAKMERVGVHSITIRISAGNGQLSAHVEGIL